MTPLVHKWTEGVFIFTWTYEYHRNRIYPDSFSLFGKNNIIEFVNLEVLS